MAVGDAMNGIVAAACGNRAFFAFSVMRSVCESTTSMVLMSWADTARMPLLAGSAMRAQVNLTAAASYGVPSVNLMPGWILSVHVNASVDVNESAVDVLTAPPSV